MSRPSGKLLRNLFYPPCGRVHFVRSNLIAHTKKPPCGGLFFGDDEIRTHDPHNAIVVLFQLSYVPE